MAGPSAHVEHLDWLIRELSAELNDLGTSVLDEPDAPIPIRGRPLYKAVQAVEQHYGGGLPIERSDKLPVAPRRAWKDMLLAADHGEGQDDQRARNKLYEDNCQTLLAWARAEFAQQAAGDQRQAEPANNFGPGTSTGFLGGAALASALGIHASQQDAFFKKLGRKRIVLGDDCWHEVRDRRPNSPHFLYRIDSSKLRDLAAAYTSPKPA